MSPSNSNRSNTDTTWTLRLLPSTRYNWMVVMEAGNSEIHMKFLMSILVVMKVTALYLFKNYFQNNSSCIMMYYFYFIKYCHNAIRNSDFKGELKVIDNGTL